MGRRWCRVINALWSDGKRRSGPPLQQYDGKMTVGLPIGRPIIEQRGSTCWTGNGEAGLRLVLCRGEIHIGGAGVLRGAILHRPGLTSERFHSRARFVAGERLLTGPGISGATLRTGASSIFGRNDHQVKIRGFRIELGG